ncbi:hypothetical protein [Nostoc sp.]
MLKYSVKTTPTALLTGNYIIPCVRSPEVGVSACDHWNFGR